MSADGWCIECMAPRVFDLVERVACKLGVYVVYRAKCRACGHESRKTVTL